MRKTSSKPVVNKFTCWEYKKLSARSSKGWKSSMKSSTSMW
nr:hypothetical protein Iba_chr08eCG6110 [Ipomoea batatas]